MEMMLIYELGHLATTSRSLYTTSGVCSVVHAWYLHGDEDTASRDKWRREVMTQGGKDKHTGNEYEQKVMVMSEGEKVGA